MCVASPERLNVMHTVSHEEDNNGNKNPTVLHSECGAFEPLNITIHRAMHGKNIHVTFYTN